MRTARPVGLTDDGRFIIVETADGESISIPADDGLRAALRNRPRRHLETELEQSMTPREIQMKIRAGASVDEIVEASGMPVSRVEAFAAPVIAERNHIAGLAQGGSVRRTGEPTGHRTLRAAVNDRLKERGVNPDSVEWDAFKMDDGRWSISATYRVEETDKVAIFYFDQRGRFSVSGNDEGRWAIGEQPDPDVAGAATPGQADEADTEPTLKLAGPADELALLRAIETNEVAGEDDTEHEADLEPQVETSENDPEPEAVVEYQINYQAEVVVGDQTEESEAPIPDEPSQLDLLYDLLGSDGYTEDSIRVFEGLSDAAAVPDVADGGWQQERDEPDADPEARSEGDTGVDAGVDAVAASDTGSEETQPEMFADGATQDALPGAEAEVEPPTAGPEAAPEAVPQPEAEHEATADIEKPAAKPRKRKRAAVPSWDEIMFGSPGPKRK